MMKRATACSMTLLASVGCAIGEPAPLPEIELEAEAYGEQISAATIQTLENFEALSGGFVGVVPATDLPLGADARGDFDPNRYNNVLGTLVDMVWKNNRIKNGFIVAPDKVNNCKLDEHWSLSCNGGMQWPGDKRIASSNPTRFLINNTQNWWRADGAPSTNPNPSTFFSKIVSGYAANTTYHFAFDWAVPAFNDTCDGGGFLNLEIWANNSMVLKRDVNILMADGVFQCNRWMSTRFAATSNSSGQITFRFKNLTRGEWGNDFAIDNFREVDCP